MDKSYFLSKSEPDPLRQPAPLFKKLDESLIEEKHARLEGYMLDRSNLEIGPV